VLLLIIIAIFFNSNTLTTKKGISRVLVCMAAKPGEHVEWWFIVLVPPKRTPTDIDRLLSKNGASGVKKSANGRIAVLLYLSYPYSSLKSDGDHHHQYHRHIQRLCHPVNKFILNQASKSLPT
jgi:hypothetical protein